MEMGSKILGMTLIVSNEFAFRYDARILLPIWYLLYDCYFLIVDIETGSKICSFVTNSLVAVLLLHISTYLESCFLNPRHFLPI